MSREEWVAHLVVDDRTRATLGEGRPVRLGPLDLRGLQVEVDITPLPDGDGLGGAPGLPAEDDAWAALWSTSAELEKVNEELTSTNAELEATSDALGDTSVQLEDLNDTLRMRSEQLDDTTAFLGELLVGLGAAVVVCDRDERIIVWNGGAELLWGLPARTAVGRRFGELELGATIAPIVGALRDCLAGERVGRRHLELAVDDAHGASRRCDVVLAPRQGRRQCVLAVVTRGGA